MAYQNDMSRILNLKYNKMKITKLKSYLFSLMAITMLTVFLSSCEKDKVEEPVVTPQNEKELITDYDKADKVLGEYIVEENGTFRLTEKDPIKLGIDPELFKELENGFNEMNNLIKEGEVKPEWIGKSFDPETMQELTVADRGCNQNSIDFHWTCATVYLSTNSASWASVVGCSAVGLAGFWPGVACAAIIQAANQWGCTCGYRAQVTYYGSLKWIYCQ